MGVIPSKQAGAGDEGKMNGVSANQNLYNGVVTSSSSSSSSSPPATEVNGKESGVVALYDEAEYFDALDHVACECYYAVQPIHSVFADPDELIFSSLHQAACESKRMNGSRFRRFESYDEAFKYVVASQEAVAVAVAALPAPPPPPPPPGGNRFFYPIRCYASVSQVALNKFAEQIEAGDLVAVKLAIDRNPHHLMTDFDTPTILKASVRYNAAHVCAKNARAGPMSAAILRLVLNCVRSREFVRAAYPSDAFPERRCQHLLNQYLNNVDKIAHETPLHMAARTGNTHVILALLEHPLCQRERVDGRGRTAAQLAPPDGAVADALQSTFYIPAVEVDEEPGPVVLEEPTENPSRGGRKRRLMALAGPMPKRIALLIHEDYRRKKRACRISGRPCFMGTSHEPFARYLRSQADRHGVLQVKQRWPFFGGEDGDGDGSDELVDIRSLEGVEKFEVFLKQLYVIKNLPSLFELLCGGGGGGGGGGRDSSSSSSPTTTTTTTRLLPQFERLVATHAQCLKPSSKAGRMVDNLCNLTSHLKYVFHSANPRFRRSCCEHFFADPPKLELSLSCVDIDLLSISRKFPRLTARAGGGGGNCPPRQPRQPTDQQPDTEIYEILAPTKFDHTIHPFIYMWIREMRDTIPLPPQPPHLDHDHSATTTTTTTANNNDDNVVVARKVRDLINRVCLTLTEA